MTTSPAGPGGQAPSEPLAHLEPSGRGHLLVEHLREVGALAARFGEELQASGYARLAGLWHDLGKYAGDFQKRIRSANGFEAHLEDTSASSERDHSSAGAVLALERFGGNGLPLAFAIAGHHAGLSNLEELKERLRKKSQRLEDARKGGAVAELMEQPKPELPSMLQVGNGEEARRRLEMWTRMLFSALCDADFLDTERFYQPERSSLRAGANGDMPKLREKLALHLEDLQRRAPDTEVNRVRAEVLGACRAAATLAPGFFSLTVPTGGGKTLAAMAFALEHAQRHGLSRVVVGIPFTSIIEQSAEVYRAALGKDAIVEHHSALDPQRETWLNRVASENWDAPVIVTTTVQLFESLFSNRPGTCRKLHNLARSVVVLDEAQTLPPGLLVPLLDGLRALVRDYGASVVFTTATQPALGRSAFLKEGLEGIREIVPESLRAFERLRRVRVRWPVSREPIGMEALAEEVAREEDVLAIVHRRADARALCQALDARLGHGETLHLSALMCADHRSHVLHAVRERKRQGKAVRLVSTQLVEAGVDLDFPVVYRALGGLDALAQAAGRCNREGRLPGLGELRIFLPESKPPRGVPETAQAVTRGMWNEDAALDLFEPGIFLRYFAQLYGAQELDRHRIQEARAGLRFIDVAKSFKLVEDDWSAPLVVLYGDAAERVRELEAAGPSRERLRALQRFTVNVKQTDRERWLATGLARWVTETVAVLSGAFRSAYDEERFGLMPEKVGIANATDLIVDG